MTVPVLTVSVTEFKAKCLAMLDDLNEHGGTITITRRGRPLATVTPPRRPSWTSPEGTWVGKVKILDDLEKLDMSELWDVVREGSGKRA